MFSLIATIVMAVMCIFNFTDYSYVWWVIDKFVA